MPNRSTAKLFRDLYLTAQAAPTVNNDASEGLLVGQRWLDESVSPAQEYILVSSAVGAAVWTKLGANSALTVVPLTDGTTITIDAAKGSVFTVTLGGSRTMAAPQHPVDGKKILIRLTQGGAGTNTITWNSAFRFSTSVPSPTLSTALGKTDYVAFIYNATASKWDAMGANLTF